MARMIVKVQNSITTTHQTQQILVYDEARTVFQQFPAEGELADMPLKSFWYAHIDKKKQLVLDRPAPEQEW